MTTPAITIRLGAEDLPPAAVHALLADTYWIRGRTVDQVARTLRNSFCASAWTDPPAPPPGGVAAAPRLVGFARLITDFVSHAYLADVVVAADLRGNGIGTRLVRRLADHEAVATCQIHLHTRDAHAVYRRLGFGDRAGMTRPRRHGGGWQPGTAEARADLVRTLRDLARAVPPAR